KCFLKAIETGLKVKVFGDARSWARADPLFQRHVGVVTHAVGDDYRKGICAARIAPCFFSKRNRDQYTRRVFEITACRGFLLCERTPMMLDLFPEDRAAVYFSSPEEFIDKVLYYLKSESDRLRIAAEGHRQVIKQGHDIHSRMRQWSAQITVWRGQCH